MSREIGNLYPHEGSRAARWAAPFALAFRGGAVFSAGRSRDRAGVREEPVRSVGYGIAMLAALAAGALVSPVGVDAFGWSRAFCAERRLLGDLAPIVAVLPFSVLLHVFWLGRPSLGLGGSVPRLVGVVHGALIVPVLLLIWAYDAVNDLPGEDPLVFWLSWLQVGIFVYWGLAVAVVTGVAGLWRGPDGGGVAGREERVVLLASVSGAAFFAGFVLIGLKGLCYIP